MTETLEIVIRNLLAFFLLWIFTRLIGKQMIANSGYHLYIVSALLGTISGNLAFNLRISLEYFVLSLFLIGGIGYFLSFISLKNKRARKWIFGESTVIIKDGTVLKQNMKKINYTMDSLEQGLRSKEIFDLTEVECAILETNGSLSVLKKPAYRNVTTEEFRAYFAKLKDH
jgi:uncharacterized membrane protein YcaP (DUF421 family)